MTLEEQLTQVSEDVNTIKGNVATVYNAGVQDGLNTVEEHASDTNIHTTAEEKQNLDARLTSVESGKVNKTSITNSTDTALSFEFAANYKHRNSFK